LGTFSDSVLTNSNNVFDPLYSGAYTLAADTRYWIQLTATSDSSANWVYDLNGNPSTEYFADASGVYTNANGPFEMAVYGAAVPEPSSLVMMGLGVAGLLSRRRKWV
jgi:hypothetical protein